MINEYSVIHLKFQMINERKQKSFLINLLQNLSGCKEKLSRH